MVEQNRIWGAGIHQMDRRQSVMSFIDQVKPVGFKASFTCGERRWVSDCVREVIPDFRWSIAKEASTEICI